MQMPNGLKSTASHHNHPEVAFWLKVHLQRLLRTQTVDAVVRRECAINEKCNKQLVCSPRHRAQRTQIAEGSLRELYYGFA